MNNNQKFYLHFSKFGFFHFVFSIRIKAQIHGNLRESGVLHFEEVEVHLIFYELIHWFFENIHQVS
jgi:hypothetical protein